MIKRTIEVSGDQLALSLAHEQIVIRRDGEIVGQVPIEETGLLIIDTPTAHYTHAVLVRLFAEGGAAVFCGPDHLPAALALPSAGHHVQSERFRVQIEAPEPRRKRLWQQIVREKIRRQAAACEDPAAKKRIEHLATQVRSGDTANAEAQAARAYWSVYLPGTDFHRKRDGPWPNPLLNYGYMAMRAAVARSVVAAGFHPSLGLQHQNRYNAFCLADDLVEPLRPLVDLEVRRLVRAGQSEIDKPAKQALLSLLTRTCRSNAGEGPLLAALERYAASLHHALAGKDDSLDFPEPLPPEETPKDSHGADEPSAE